MTVQGPVKEQQPDGMSHRGGGGAVAWSAPGKAAAACEQRWCAGAGGGSAGERRVAVGRPFVRVARSARASVAGPRAVTNSLATALRLLTVPSPELVFLNKYLPYPPDLRVCAAQGKAPAGQATASSGG